MSVLSLVRPLAYLSLPVILLRSLSNASPIARYYIRLGVYVSAIGLCSVWGVIAAIGLNLGGDKYNVNWVVARSFYAITSRVFGLKFEVEGEEHMNTRPAIFVGNHQSMLDLIYVGRCVASLSNITCRFMAPPGSSPSVHRS